MPGELPPGGAPIEVGAVFADFVCKERCWEEGGRAQQLGVVPTPVLAQRQTYQAHNPAQCIDTVRGEANAAECTEAGHGDWMLSAWWSRSLITNEPHY